MKKTVSMQIKKVVAMLLVGVTTLSLLAGCGNKEEVTLVSEESKSGVWFEANYEDFLMEEFNMIFADAQDESYMLSMEVLERPGEWSWQEVLIQCGNANVEEFILAGLSFYDWKKVEINDGQMEYMTVNEEDVLYSVGVVAMKDANYGVLIYGNFGEDVLLKTAQDIVIGTEKFEIEMSGLIQNISLSNRGKSLENYKVSFFENEQQVSAYLSEQSISLKLKQIREGKDISLAGNSGTAVGCGWDANGKIFFAGQGQGSVASYGLIELAEGQGLLLLEYTNRSREVSVESLPECFEMLNKFFRS